MYESMKATVDRDMAAAHFAAVWGPHLAEADDAKLSLSFDAIDSSITAERTRKPLTDFTSRLMLAANPELFIGETLKRAENGNTYIGVAFMSKDAKGRGKAVDIVGIPALWIDIDTIDGDGSNGHKAADNAKNPHPTMDEAIAVLNTLPIAPSMLVHTGGGLHAWFALDRLLLPAEFDLLKRWKQLVISAFKTASLHIDEGTFDPARVLRLAGTVNRKRFSPLVSVSGEPFVDAEGRNLYEPQPRTATIYADDSENRYSIEFLDEIFPAIAEKVSKSTGARNGSNGSSGSSATTRASYDPESRDSGEPSADENARDTWRRRVHSADLFEALGFEFVGRTSEGVMQFDAPSAVGNAWGLSESEFPVEQKARISCYSDGGYAVHGDGTARRLGVKPGAQENADTSWNLLACALCGGDFAEAGRIAQLSAFDARTAVALWVASGRSFATDASPVAKAGHTGWHSLTDNFAIADDTCTTHRLGVYKLRLVKDSVTKEAFEVWDEKLDWYPRIKTETRRISPSGTKSLFDVEIVTRNGRNFVACGLDDTEVDTPSEWRRQSHARGVHVPHESDVLGVLRTGVYTVQYEDTEIQKIYTAMGWRETEEGLVYLSPRGSVTAKGIDTSFTVGPPQGSASEDLQRNMAAYGFDTVLEGKELKTAAEKAISGWVAAFGHTPELCWSMLGVLFAAPLRLDVRGTLYIAAPGGRGKSVIASRLQQWYGDFANRSFPVTFHTVTKAGAEAMAAWCEGMCVFDDFKNSQSDRNSQARMEDALDAIVRGAYGNIETVKSTANGGVAASVRSVTYPIVTGEALPSNSTTNQRLIAVTIQEGDFDLQGARLPLDDFSDLDGIPRAVYASYLRWLCVRIEQMGGLKKFRAWTATLARQEFQNRGNGRSGETVVPVSVGLRMLSEFAEESGFAGLVTQHTKAIDFAIGRMIQANLMNIDDSNYELRAIETLRAELTTRSAALDVEEGLVLAPERLAEIGWKNGSARSDIQGRLIGKAVVIAGEIVFLLHPTKLKHVLAELAAKPTNPQILEWFKKVIHPGNDHGFYKEPAGQRYLPIRATALFGPAWVAPKDDNTRDSSKG
jgi:hypothetical protein